MSTAKQKASGVHDFTQWQWHEYGKMEVGFHNNSLNGGNEKKWPLPVTQSEIKHKESMPVQWLACSMAGLLNGWPAQWLPAQYKRTKCVRTVGCEGMKKWERGVFFLV